MTRNAIGTEVANYEHRTSTIMYITGTMNAPHDQRRLTIVNQYHLTCTVKENKYTTKGRYQNSKTSSSDNEPSRSASTVGRLHASGRGCRPEGYTCTRHLRENGREPQRIRSVGSCIASAFALRKPSRKVCAFARVLNADHRSLGISTSAGSRLRLSSEMGGSGSYGAALEVLETETHRGLVVNIAYIIEERVTMAIAVNLRS